MSAIPLDTHKAIKLLTDSGVEPKQAEAMVQLFNEAYANDIVTKADLNLLHNDLKSEMEINKNELKSDIEQLKLNNSWNTKILFAIGVPVFIASVKYIFGV